ncbi:hypothetical protein FSP39_017896, partial [Pinctada imbricata]
IRIAALNDTSSDVDSDDGQAITVGTKEAEESEAYQLYNKALSLQRQDLHKAEDAFEQLLSHAFIREAAKLIENETVGATHPGLQLLYSIYKNLASMALQQGEDETAMEWYIEAVKVDETEVTVWYKIGTIGLKLHNYRLARLGFEQGLQCNPNHWPCLDNVITVLYTINDYYYCLYFIAKALEKDHLYPKGLAFRKQILKEQPSLEQYTMEMFTDCYDNIKDIDVDQEEIDEYVNEALAMREKRRELAREPEHKPYKLPLPVKSFTWRSVGESLLALYNKIKSSNPPMSLSLRVDMSDYATTESATSSMEVQNEIQRQEEKMDVDTDKDKIYRQYREISLPASVVPVDEGSVVSMSNPSTPTTTLSVVDCLFDQGGSGVSDTDSRGRGQKRKRNLLLDVDLYDHEGSDVSDTDSRGIGQKRKRNLLLDVDLYGKRRSARVRNTFRTREEDKINFQEVLMNCLPQTLKYVSDDEDLDMVTMDTTSQSAQTMNQVPNTPQEKRMRLPDDCVRIEATEDKDVREFLQNQQKNCGVLGMMKCYTEKLAQKYNTVWPKDLAAVFLKVFTKLRKHLDVPCLYSKEETDEYLNDIGKACLLSSELQLDQWLSSRPKMSPGSPKRSSSNQLQYKDLPDHIEDDLCCISDMTAYPEVLGDQYLHYSVRVFWLKARFYMLQGETEDALCCFNRAKYFLERAKEEEQITEVLLYNCQNDNVVTLELLKNQEDFLQRSQSLEETQRLYQAGEYRKVTDFLTHALSQPHSKHMVTKPGLGQTERIEQLLLLQDCLVKLKDFERAIYWGEVSFHEAFQEYRNAKTSPLKEEWSKTLHQIWTNMLKMIESDAGALIGLPATNMVRLSGNLVSVIDIMMAVPEIATDMPIGSVLPWLLLYRLVEHEERRVKLTEETKVEESDENLPNSLTLLNVAHEYLGRHRWCTKSDGAVLTFYMDIIKRELKEKNKYKNLVRQAYEQCIYCLYGHPNKKGRARHLMDHNAPQIDMSWEVAADIFEYFKPKVLPEFDSVKAETVSADFESLYRRIAQLVPGSEKPVLWIESVQSYIDGETNEVPTAAPGDISCVSKLIYYLLADYYGKNIEHGKAIKFYMYDLCYNPVRLDSWAGMALARMCQLEQKLNAAELKMDVPVHKKAIAALRCFKRAVEIEDASGKLWMEYGSLSYQLHSHASRQLKYHNEKKDELDEDFLEEELQQIAQESRQEMLQTAYNCYKNASECEDEESEEWLTQYMMGKCIEKMKRGPKDYLEHYKLAAAALHDENAMYPKKITYAYTSHTSPRLAVEALEMFYRLHVSILKLLLKKKEEKYYDLYQQYIDEASESPFAKAVEKKDESKEGAQSSNEITSSGIDMNKSTTTQQDHTYSKQKNPISINENLTDGQDSVVLETASDVHVVTMETGKAKKEARAESADEKSADSTDEKFVDSADESRNSSDYFPSNESEAESDDSQPDIDIDLKELTAFAESQLQSAALQGRTSPVIPVTMAKTSMLELTAEVLEASQSSRSSTVVVKSQPGKIEEGVHDGKSTEQPMEVELSKQVSDGFTPSKEEIVGQIGEDDALKKINPDTDIHVGANSIDEESKKVEEKDDVHKVKAEEPEDVKSEEKPGDVNISNPAEEQKSVTKSESMETQVIEIFSSPEPVKTDQFFPQNEKGKEVTPEKHSTAEGTENLASNKDEQQVECPSGVVVLDFTDGQTIAQKLEKLDDDPGAEKPKSEQLGQRDVPMETEVMNEGSDEAIKSEVSIRNSENQPIKNNVQKAEVSDDCVIILDSESESEINQKKVAEDGGKKESKSPIEDLTLKEISIEKEKNVDVDMTDQGESIKTEGKNLEEVKNEGFDKNTANDIVEGTSAMVKDTNTKKDNMEQGEPSSIRDESKNKEINEAPNEKSSSTTKENKPDKDTEKNECSESSKSVTDIEMKDSSKPSRRVLMGDALHKDLIEKCMAALHLCLSRFPTHYKSLYRLAYVYFYSPYHKNLHYARDLLFGTQNWQSLSYMPAPGLFTERKLNNFFQGTWKLPIDEVERSGSFATHLNKAVLLLLKILCEQNDVHSLYHVHLQLNKTPEAGKKYLRDGERTHYSKLALDYCLEAVKSRIPDVRKMADHDKAVRSLMETYRIWNYTISKHKALSPRVNNLLAATYKAVMKAEVNPDKPVLEQAIKFCQNQQQKITQARQQKQFGAKSQSDKENASHSSDSSFMSPDKSFNQSLLFSPQRTNQVQNNTTVAREPSTQTKSVTTAENNNDKNKSGSDLLTTIIVAGLQSADKDEKGGTVSITQTKSQSKPDSPVLLIKTPPTPDLTKISQKFPNTGNTNSPKSASTSSQRQDQKTGLQKESAARLPVPPKMAVTKTLPKDDEVIEILSSSDEDETVKDKSEEKLTSNVARDIGSNSASIKISEKVTEQRTVVMDSQTSEKPGSGTNIPQENKIGTGESSTNISSDQTAEKLDSISNKSVNQAADRMENSTNNAVESQAASGLQSLTEDMDGMKSEDVDMESDMTLDPETGLMRPRENQQDPPGPYLDPTTGHFVID